MTINRKSSAMKTKTHECKKCDIEFVANVHSRPEDITPTGGWLEWIICDGCKSSYPVKLKGPSLKLKKESKKAKPTHRPRFRP